MGTRSLRGSALVTAIFFMLVVFLFATILTERVNLNLRYTHHEADRLRKAFLAKAAVNEFMVMVSQDSSLENATAAQPHVNRWDGYVVESWLEPDPDLADFFHVRGRAYPEGRPSLAEDFSRVVRKRPEIESVVFANSPDLRIGQPDSMFYYRSTEAEWKLMPLPPKAVHGSNGVVRQSPGEFSENLLGFTGSNDGFLYGKYNPILEDTSLFATIIRRVYERATGGVDARAAALVHGVNELFEDSSVSIPFGGSVSSEDGVPLRYNVAQDSWEVLEPIPADYYDDSGNLVRTGEFGFPGVVAGMTVNDTDLYAAGLKPGVDSVLHYDIENRTWNSLPPAPNTYYDEGGTLHEEPGFSRSIYQVAMDSEGQVYAQWGKYGAGHAIFRFDEVTQEWNPLPPLPRTYYDPDGNLISEGGNAIKSSLITAGGDGEVYAIYFRTMETDDPEASDTLFKFANGQWLPQAPPRLQTHQPDGTLVTEAETDAVLNVATVDAEGSVVSHYRRESDYDRIYRSTEGGHQALPRLPKEGHDRRGNHWQESGFFDFIHVAVGGGIKNNDGTRFVSTASY